jgi:hypothetical protein
VFRRSSPARLPWSTEAAGEKTLIDRGMAERVTVTLDAAQVAWSRLAKRWGELTSQDSRADPVLTRTASEVRAAISATACTLIGWATPDAIGHRSPSGAVWLLFEPVEEQPEGGSPQG